jgi:hypothetical protein
VAQHDTACGEAGRVADDVQVLELPGAAVAADLGLEHERFDVAVEEFLLLVGQRLEIVEHAREFGIGQLEAEFLDALAQGRAAAVLAKHEIGAGHAHVVRPHDLVRRVMLQHAVLVDAGFVRERVLADHCLVARNRHARDAREQAAGRKQAPGVDAGVQAVDAFTHLERHRDLFERRIARTLTDAVDRAFHLARAAADGSEAVGHGQPQVVVAVDAEGHFVRATHVLRQEREDVMEFLGDRVTDGVGHVDRGRAGFDHGFDHFTQELGLGARGILGRELDVLAQAARVLHAFDGGVDDLLFSHVELVLAMDRAGGEEHVDARPGGHLDRAPRLVDVLAVAAREARDDRAPHFTRDFMHGFPVAR